MNTRINELKEILRTKEKVQFNTVIKNGVELTGVSLSMNEPTYINPVLYLETMLEAPIPDDLDLDEIADIIITNLYVAKNDAFSTAISERLKDNLNKEYILDNVYATLEKHYQYADEVRTQSPLEDCDEVFRVKLTDSNDTNATFKVTYQLLNNLDITVYELKKHAELNSAMNTCVKDMFGLLVKEIGIDEKEISGWQEECNDLLYIGFKNGTHGSGSIFNYAILDAICKQYNSEYIWIIPSSIHELLILNPSIMDKEYVKQMVKNVNNEVVSENEILSYHVYEYNTALKTFETL